MLSVQSYFGFFIHYFAVITWRVIFYFVYSSFREND